MESSVPRIRSSETRGRILSFRRSCPLSFRRSCPNSAFRALRLWQLTRRGGHNRCGLRDVNCSASSLVRGIPRGLVSRERRHRLLFVGQLSHWRIDDHCCSRWLIRCQSWVGYLPWLHQLVKPEAEQPTDERANSEETCDCNSCSLSWRASGSHGAKAT
jgi:hypothetical protein